MKHKKLNSKEIDQLVDRIRCLYNDYMVKFIQGGAMRDGFEQRYLDALKTRIDLQRFLQVELKIVQQMIAREDAELSRCEDAAYLRERDPAAGNDNGAEDDGRDKAPTGDFADRVIEQMQRKAEKYPPGQTQLDIK